MASSSGSAGGGTKRSRSQELELDLEAERQTRRRIQQELSAARFQKRRDKHTISELRAALRSMQEQVTAANERAEEALLDLEAFRLIVQMDSASDYFQEALEEDDEVASVLSALEDDNNDALSKCPICLEDIFDVEAWTPACGHDLHVHCMRELMSHPACASRCPVCRGPLCV